MAACVTLIIESLESFEHKYEYAIIGHSGLTSDLRLVDYSKPPVTVEDKALVLERIYAHARSAPTGDKSLQAVVQASSSMVLEERDEYLLFLFSDANLGRYGISPTAIALALDGGVNAASSPNGTATGHPSLSSAPARGTGVCKGYCILIAEPDAASWLVQSLPFGRGFVALEPSKLPLVFKEVFTHAAIN